MKGSQSINDLSSFPEPSSQGNTLPRSRGKEGTTVVEKRRHDPSKRRVKPRRPVSLHVEALQRSMVTGHHGGSLSPTGDECPQLGGVGVGRTSTGNGMIGEKHSVPHQSALNTTSGDGGAESDETVLGDLGESSSSGFVGSEVLVQPKSPSCPSSLVSTAQFLLNSPVSNFPTLAVTPELYRVDDDDVEEKSKADEEDLDRFSEDSLAESPGKQRRVSLRLAELARKIEQEDSLAIVDSLATDTLVPLDSITINTNQANIESDSLLPVPSLPLMDSLMPGREVKDTSIPPEDSLLPDTGRLTEDSGLPADSLVPIESCLDEDSLMPVLEDVPTFTEQLDEINAALKDIEDHQERINLRMELRKLQRELKEISDNDTSSTNSPSRAKWRPMDVQIATDDLTCNPEMSFSYDNMAPLLDCFKSTSPPLPSNEPLLPPPTSHIRDKGYSPDTSSEDEEEEVKVEVGAQNQLPRPIKAKLPPPIPNMPLLQEKPEPKPKPAILATSLPSNMKGVRDLQPAHPGPVGMTSMWIPSSNNSNPSVSLSSSRSSLASPLTTSRSSLSSTRAPPSPRTPRLRPRTNTGPIPPNVPSVLSKRLSLLTPVLPDKSSPGLATNVRFQILCSL